MLSIAQAYLIIAGIVALYHMCHSGMAWLNRVLT